MGIKKNTCLYLQARVEAILASARQNRPTMMAGRSAPVNRRETAADIFVSEDIGFRYDYH